MDTRLDVLAAGQGGVFTFSQAICCGISRGCLRSAVKQQHLWVVRRNVLTTRERIEGVSAGQRHRLDIAAALLVRKCHADAGGVPRPPVVVVAGHRSAGLLWDLSSPPPPIDVGAGETPPPDLSPVYPNEPVPGVLPRRVVELVSADRCRRTYRWGVNVRPADLPATHITTSSGIRVTTPARTALDLIRELPWPEAIAVADRVLRLGTSHLELATVAQHCRLWRGGMQGVRAVGFADRRAESPAESRARAVFAELGLPAPELQVDIYDAHGLVARADFLFRGFRTVVEIDGKVKYTNPLGPPGEVLWREKLREDRLRDAGYEVVRVTWAQLLHDPEAVKARILAAFSRAMRLAG